MFCVEITQCFTMPILRPGIEWKVKFMNSNKFRIAILRNHEYRVIYTGVGGINPSFLVGEIKIAHFDSGIASR